MSPTHVKTRTAAGILNYTDWVIRGMYVYISKHGFAIKG